MRLMLEDELMEAYQIPILDKKNNYEYQIPSVQAIGRVYQMLILNVCQNRDIVDTLIRVFQSFICEEISDFNSNIYYSNPDYLRCSYLEGRMLAYAIHDVLIFHIMKDIDFWIKNEIYYEK